MRYALLAALLLTGCATQSEDARCREVKPGAITTANSMCVMVNADPVDPSVEPINWKGQKIGLCCEECRPKWDRLTDAQKDAAVAKVLAKPR